jgi:hypothetical protein
MRRLIIGAAIVLAAAEFAARTAGEQAPNISVCVIQEDSTLRETAEAAKCLAQLQPHHVLS